MWQCVCYKDGMYELEVRVYLYDYSHHYVRINAVLLFSEKRENDYGRFQMPNCPLPSPTWRAAFPRRTSRV